MGPQSDHYSDLLFVRITNRLLMRQFLGPVRMSPVSEMFHLPMISLPNSFTIKLTSRSYGKRAGSLVTACIIFQLHRAYMYRF